MRFCQSLMYADPGQWVELARHAEDVGFDELALSDHVFYPENLTSEYPYTSTGKPVFKPEAPWPDVWVMVGAMAAVTQRIAFTTNVYVLPLRNPFVVAKAVGTASFLSGDRVSLGIGAGWMREEFDCLEQPFERRGARMEEQVEVLRALWQGGLVEHHGEFYDFDKLQMAPVPTRPVPIVVGGQSDAALRRAARNDGWFGADAYQPECGARAAWKLETIWLPHHTSQRSAVHRSSSHSLASPCCREWICLVPCSLPRESLVRSA